MRAMRNTRTRLLRTSHPSGLDRARLPALLAALLLSPLLSGPIASARTAQPPAASRASDRASPNRGASNQADLAKIDAYLNSIRTLKAHFLQVAPDGSVSEGTAWMERPGRMRFQYAPPSPLLLVAGGGLVLFRDASLNQTSTIPLSSTPLGILLAKRVQLSGPVEATSIRHLPGEIEVTLQDRAKPAQGSLSLVFTTDPLALRQWTITDAQRQRTTVTLENVETGGQFPSNLFNVAQIPAGATGH
jgi:outer membrane lipoprotein-sorting protein